MRDQVPNLTKREELREVLYHLFDIVEIQDEIKRLLLELNRAYAHDAEETANLLSDLEVQVFDHLGYHWKEIRAPLRAKVTEAFNVLGDEED